MALFGKRRADSTGTTTLFFASDLHGSEICFKKFVNAASFYKADVLVLGGDISGKIVIPIVEAGHGVYKARMHGRDTTVPDTGLEEFERRAWNSGLYTRRMSPEEYTHLSEHPEAVEDLFSEVVVATVRRWIDYAHDRLEGSGVTIVNAPGNDDPFVIDDVLREHGRDTLRFVEGEIIEIAPGHEMLSTGATNQTPWNTHREYSEEEIAARVSRMTAQLENPSTAVFNIHVPPYASGLDTAPMLAEDLSVRTSAGAQMTAPVGSTSVRQAIEDVQPLLSLHGHIHECGGSVRMGRTLVVNSGSEYGEGILRGVLVTIGDGRILRHQSVTG